MTRADVVSKVLDLAETEWPHQTMKLDTPFEGLDIDSLDRVEFVMSVEKEFDLDIHDDQSEKWQNLQDVVNHICGVNGIHD